MSAFICPICKAPLLKEERLYRCENSHSFDKAKSGYVNLLTPDKMNSKNPGDGKEMVASRKAFLDKGYYAPLRDKLSEIAKSLAPASPIYLDAGCGTGYYTKAVSDALHTPETVGVDISKHAVNLSAKGIKEGEFAVASVYDLPLPDNSVDLVTNVFSPMADKEYFRVMKKGGHLIYVVPATSHLMGLKTLIYDNPYPNLEEDVTYDGFLQVDKVKLEFDMTLQGSDDILSLFTMTPYFWRSPKGAEEKIKNTSTLLDRAEFYVLIFKK